MKKKTFRCTFFEISVFSAFHMKMNKGIVLFGKVRGEGDIKTSQFFSPPMPSVFCF